MMSKFELCLQSLAIGNEATVRWPLCEQSSNHYHWRVHSFWLKLHFVDLRYAFIMVVHRNANSQLFVMMSQRTATNE